MSSNIEVGIIAAMELEVRSLIAGWTREDVRANGRSYACYRDGNAVLTCSGPGYKNAWESTKVLIEQYTPRMVLSTGFAGALTDRLAVTDLFVPEHVIKFGSGTGFSTGLGQGRLLTADAVIGRQGKAEAAARYEADAVDMEAAAVAEIAQARGCRFAALKAISDDAQAEMDFVGKFVAAEGFRTGPFLAHIALRPWLWSSVRELRANSERASANLCDGIRAVLQTRDGIESGLAALAGNHAEQRTSWQ